MRLSIHRVGPQAAATVWHVVGAAFAARPPLDPPAAALGETVESLARALAAAGGLLAEIDDRPVGTLVLDPQDDALWLRRVGVLPEAQQHGVAHALVVEAVAVARAAGHSQLAVLARQELPRNVAFWEGVGFTAVAESPPYVELRLAIGPEVTGTHRVGDADAMRALGEALAARLAPGDLVLLIGELGAGKTTFTQGLGAGLGVRGDITSPTFVLARVHPSLVGGPALVHVDAYRLGTSAELDDLDLDASLEDAVTVVEWGEGIAERLAAGRWEVRIDRGTGTEPDEDDERVVRIAVVGEVASAPGTQPLHQREPPR